MNDKVDLRISFWMGCAGEKGLLACDFDVLRIRASWWCLIFFWDRMVDGCGVIIVSMVKRIPSKKEH